MRTEIKVHIEWDYPDDQEGWLNPMNIKLALGTFCPNTNFKVCQIYSKRELLNRLLKRINKGIKLYWIITLPFALKQFRKKFKKKEVK